MVCVAALLSVDSVFLTPPSLRDKMAAAHRRFHSPHGDHLTLLAVYHAYTAASGKKVRGCVYVSVEEMESAVGLVQGKLHPSAKPASCIGCSTTVGRAEQ